MTREEDPLPIRDPRALLRGIQEINETLGVATDGNTLDEEVKNKLLTIMARHEKRNFDYKFPQHALTTLKKLSSLYPKDVDQMTPEALPHKKKVDHQQRIFSTKAPSPQSSRIPLRNPCAEQRKMTEEILLAPPGLEVPDVHNPSDHALLAQSDNKRQ